MRNIKYLNVVLMNRFLSISSLLCCFLFISCEELRQYPQIKIDFAHNGQKRGAEAEAFHISPSNGVIVNLSQLDSAANFIQLHTKTDFFWLFVNRNETDLALLDSTTLQSHVKSPSFTGFKPGIKYLVLMGHKKDSTDPKAMDIGYAASIIQVSDR